MEIPICCWWHEDETGVEELLDDRERNHSDFIDAQKVGLTQQLDLWRRQVLEDKQGEDSIDNHQMVSLQTPCPFGKKLQSKEYVCCITPQSWLPHCSSADGQVYEMLTCTTSPVLLQDWLHNAYATIFVLKCRVWTEDPRMKVTLVSMGLHLRIPSKFPTNSQQILNKFPSNSQQIPCK